MSNSNNWPTWPFGGSVGMAIADPVPVQVSQEEFKALANEWRKGTRGVSMVRQMVMHPAYQRIIGMGPGVVPLILNELESRPSYWFHALRALTGDDPVQAEDRGNLKLMSDAWLKWGRETGHLE